MKSQTLQRCLFLLACLQLCRVCLYAQDPIDVSPMTVDLDTNSDGIKWKQRGWFTPFPRYQITDQGEIVAAYSRRLGAPGFTVYDMETLQISREFALGRWTIGSKAKCDGVSSARKEERKRAGIARGWRRLRARTAGFDKLSEKQQQDLFDQMQPADKMEADYYAVVGAISPDLKSIYLYERDETRDPRQGSTIYGVQRQGDYFLVDLESGERKPSPIILDGKPSQLDELTADQRLGLKTSGQVNIFDNQTHQLLRKLPASDNEVHFSHDGKRVVVAGEHPAQVFEVDTGKELCRIRRKDFEKPD